MKIRVTTPKIEHISDLKAAYPSRHEQTGHHKRHHSDLLPPTRKKPMLVSSSRIDEHPNELVCLIRIGIQCQNVLSASITALQSPTSDLRHCGTRCVDCQIARNLLDSGSIGDVADATGVVTNWTTTPSLLTVNSKNQEELRGDLRSVRCARSGDLRITQTACSRDVSHHTIGSLTLVSIVAYDHLFEPESGVPMSFL